MTITSQLFLPIAFKNFHLAKNTTQLVLAERAFAVQVMVTSHAFAT